MTPSPHDLASPPEESLPGVGLPRANVMSEFKQMCRSDQWAAGCGAS
jgi:hypothetical protein